MGGEGPTEAIDVALELVERVQDDPRAVQAGAGDLLGHAELSPDVIATAHWALGLAARQLNDLVDAATELETAIEVAIAAGLHRRAGQIRSSLSLVRLYQGDTDGALGLARTASQDLEGGDLARNQKQTALILQRLGDLSGALEQYEHALVGLRRVGDRLAEARLLANRGVLHAYRGELDEGTADLELAIHIARELHQGLLEAGCSHNLGFLEGQRGDVPAALSWFDRAEEAYESLGRPPGMVEALWADRARLVLGVGLFEEAERVAAAALSSLEASGNVTDLSETRLLVAEVALAAGKPDDALEQATTAAREFHDQDRATWGLLADYAALRARFTTADPTLRPDAAEQVASGLRSTGLVTEADDCLLLAGRLSLRTGDVDLARDQLRDAAEARTRGTAAMRTQAWLAEALLRRAEGNSLGMSRAIDAGIRVIREYRATLGASELRSYAATHGVELARLATEHAIQARAPWRVLRAVEDWRSVSRQVAPVRPPADPELTDLLTQLRRVETESRDLALAGQRSDHLRPQRTRLERKIRDLERRTRGTGRYRVTASWTRDRVLDSTGGRELITFFTHDAHIHAVLVRDGTARLIQTMEIERAQAEVSSLLFSLNRLALGTGSERSLAAAHEAMETRLASLREGLLGTIEDTGRPVTVIPTGALHRLPWSALLPDRAMSVVPSLEAWSRASKRAEPLTREAVAALIAGPELNAADREVSLVAPSYRSPRTLQGEEATATAALGALDGADLAHIAAHGSFRSDNPSFSSLEMSDGPLTVYDLEHVQAPPAVMVLSSCDTGVAKVVAGSELLGLSSALIDTGVANLIAPVVPISDELTPPLMADLHQRLAAGIAPPAALSSVLQQGGETPQDQALRASFVCMGA